MRTVRTRIIATVGPACEAPSTLVDVIRAGADVLRINASHVSPGAIGPWVRRIRAAARAAGRHAAALVDLPGTKIRVGDLGPDGSVELSAGDRVRVVRGRRGGGSARIPVHPLPWLGRLVPGTRILLADGQLELEVVGRDERGLDAVVTVGGRLLAGKGVHVPGARFPTRVPTAEDVALLEAAVAADADAIALSFVRDAGDVDRARAHLERLGRSDIPLVAKIEREDAVEAIDAILERANVAIVARGDLGVDVGPEYVPSLQRRILAAARRHGRPAYVATEMLESMIERSRPTRAEASDVAGAVFDGADGVMLSAETAIGRHPVLAVRTMDRILAVAESDPNAPYADTPGFVPPDRSATRPDRQVVRAAVGLAASVGAAAIVVLTREGASAFRISKERPRTPIVAYGPRDSVLRRLSLAWGIVARRLPGGRTSDARIEAVAARLRRDEGLPAGATVVVVMGGPTDPAGTTTSIKLLRLDDRPRS